MTEREGWRRQSTKQYPDSSSSPCVRQSREPLTVLDSRFRTVDWGFQVPDFSFWSVELRFRIPIISGIPDSGFFEQDFRFQSPGCWIQQAKFFRSLDSTSKNFPDLGNLDYITIWITLGEAAI